MNEPLVVNTPDGPRPGCVHIKRVQYVCPYCGGTDILWDATARWNVHSQQMELNGTQDTTTCQSNECGGNDINPIEVELPILRNSSYRFSEIDKETTP
jgi:hypothetical protein